MPKWLVASLVLSLSLPLAFAARSVEAKGGALTFEKIVIVAGGEITEPVEITDEADLRDTGLDSIRPQVPPQDVLGTAYQLILYPDGSDVTMKVTYYAPRTGDRGYIDQEKSVDIGGGTLHPGWNQPSAALELTLRKHGAVNLAGGSFQLETWQAIVIPVGVAVFVSAAFAAGWSLRRRLHRLEKASLS